MNALLTEQLRFALLRELDASRVVLNYDLKRLPHGERVTDKEIFLDPVVDDPELALEESEEERALEGAERDVVGVDYAGAEEALLDEESALWSQGGDARGVRQGVRAQVRRKRGRGGIG